MNRLTTLAILHSSLLILQSLSAAVDQRWTCETSRVEPVYFTVYHGETLKLDAKLLSNGRPVTNVTVASFLWQTNGMGSAWWQTNATVQAGHVLATFTPAMDPGASSVTFFFQVTDLDGSNYRPSGKLYLVKSLGDNPTFPDIPPPGGTIDFSSLTLVNAPWATLDAAQSAVSDGINQALNAVANESNRAERTYAKLSDIPTVPSIAGLATTGDVQAARSAAISAAASSAASLYQPLSGMSDYAKLSDIPTVPSVSGLATTGEVNAARSAAISAAASSAASLYQPLSGMSDYARLTDIPAVPSIAGLATTGEVQAAASAAQAAAESTAASLYQPLISMTNYPQRHEVPTVTLSNNVLTVNGQTATISGGGSGGVDTNAVTAIVASAFATNATLSSHSSLLSQLSRQKRDYTDLSYSNTVTYADWTPSHTPIPDDPQVGDTFYTNIVKESSVWTCLRYTFINGHWVLSSDIQMSGDYTNPFAAELTFPDGTKTYRKRTITDTLALTSQVDAKLDADDPVLTATAPSAASSSTSLAGAKATGEALDEKADEFTKWEFSGDTEGYQNLNVSKGQIEGISGYFWQLKNGDEVLWSIDYGSRDQLELNFQFGEKSIDATRNRRVLLTGDAQEPIQDLATIRSGAAAGATAYQLPPGGIPRSDLVTGVRNDLTWAGRSVASFVPIGGVTPSVTNHEADLSGLFSADNAALTNLIHTLIDARLGDINAVLEAALDGSEVQ